MAIPLSNNATATLASSINTSVTTISVASGLGALFPSISSPDYYYCTLADVTNTKEIVKVTARTSDSFTVVRAQEGTVATAYSAGDRFELRLTAAAFANKLDKDTGGTVGGSLTVSGPLTVTGVAQFSGQTIIGDASGDSVVHNASTMTVPNGLSVSGGTVNYSALTIASSPAVSNSTGDARYASLTGTYTKTESDTNFLAKASNLSDVANAATARTNLGVPATTATLLKADNLSTLADFAAAVGNLGLAGTISNPGYMTIPINVSGVRRILYIQFGNADNISGDATVTVTFPVPFPSTCIWSAAFTHQYFFSPSGDVLAFSTGITTTTQMFVSNNSKGSLQNVDARWIAIGY